MALTFSQFKDRSREIIQVPFAISYAAGIPLQNPWVNTQQNGAAPTTAALCTDQTLGALGLNEGFRFTEDYYILGVEGLSASTTSFAIIDRLAHQGGLDGTITTEQTTNLPLGTGLTRYDPAVDRIQAAAMLYGNIGATATTFTVRYTNSANTVNRVSQPTVIGGTANNIAARFAEICPADSDKFKTIEGFTLAASTGTVGNIGLVLFVKLCEGYSRPQGYGGGYGYNLQNWYTGDMDLPIAKAGACLNLIGRNVNSSSCRGYVNLMRVNP